MFTGIVRELGTVLGAAPSPAGLALSVSTRLKASEGDSIAVNGVCLSARPGKGRVTFDVVFETLSKTNLGKLKEGDRVNLEPSLQWGDPLGGHFVMGHVDGVGTILGRDPFTVRVPKSVTPFLAPKGSISVDGVSLTVVKVVRDTFTVALIPLTLEKTTLGFKGKGDAVNIEADMAARYKKPGSRISRQFLKDAGFIGKS